MSPAMTRLWEPKGILSSLHHFRMVEGAGEEDPSRI